MPKIKKFIYPTPLHTHILPFLWRCQGRKKLSAAACTFPHFWAPKIGGKIKKKRRIGATFLMTAISRARAGKKSEGGGGSFFMVAASSSSLFWFFSRLDIQSGRKMDSHLKKIQPLFFLGAKIPFLPWGRKENALERERRLCFKSKVTLCIWRI